MNERVGMVTIGQSPRDDVLPGFLHGLGGLVEIRQAGALDDLTEAEIAGLAPEEGGYHLITRLRDGRSVIVGRERILPHLFSAIRGLEQEGVDLIILLCTGTFPELTSKVPLIEPDRILLGVVKGILPTGRLGVITPLTSQIGHTQEKWSGNWTVSIKAALPYTRDDEIDPIAREMAATKPGLVILDCLGFRPTQGLRVRRITGVTTIVPQTLIGRMAAEVLGM